MLGRPIDSRHYRIAAGAILAVAMAWRIVLAIAMPAVSRDGALFCWYARDLGQHGVSVLRGHEYDQHPLFPLCVLACERLLAMLGIAEGPLRWQFAGQAVSLFGGGAVVALVGLLTLRQAQSAGQRADARRAALLAMAIAAVLPLNTWLSADVMSDQPFAALYVGALCALGGSLSLTGAFAAGLLAGLAYLTRPEGAVLFAAGVAAICTAPWLSPARKAAAIVSLCAAIGLACGPYFLTIGGLSQKADKEPIQKFVAPASAADSRATEVDGFAYAALSRHETRWYQAIGISAYETLRAGRVVVPLAALPTLLLLGRRLTRHPAIPATICAAAQFMLMSLLQWRHGYLDPRHALPVVILLIPAAAAMLDALLSRWPASNSAAGGEPSGISHLLAAPLAIIAVIAPLALYSLRIPNGADGWVRETSTWLVAHDPQVSQKLLLGGASERRVAFYTGARWQPWPENEPDVERRYGALRDHVLLHRPAYVLMRTDAERRDGAELIRRLSEEPELRQSWGSEHEVVDNRGGHVSIIALDWRR